MEGKRFDDLSRAVATMSSRRRVLRGLVGGAVAGVAGTLGLRGAEAARVKRASGDLCRKADDCESGICEPDGTGRKRCGCTDGNTLCYGSCCQSYCSPEYGCADPYVDLKCYDSCESQFCFGTNQTFNYNFNSGSSCQEYCANACWDIG